MLDKRREERKSNPMIKRTKHLLLASVAMLAFAGAGAAWGASSSKSAALSTTTTASKHAGGELVAPALVEAEHETVSLAFEGGGRIVEVLVREGDRVKAGDVVARLDDRLQRAMVAKATAALTAAQARSDAAQNGARSDEVRAAAAEVDAATAQAAERERQAARAVELHGSGAIASAQLDADRTAAESARAHAAAATARLSLLRSGTRAEQRREAHAAVEAARADLEEAQARLAQTELRAATSGIVLRRFSEPGEQVATVPPTIVLTIADVDHLILRAEVDESDIGRVAVGQKGYATAEALGSKKVRGHIVRVERELGRKKIRTDDPRARVDTRVLEVSIALDENEPLPLGLRVDVHLDPRN
jgi:ABC exporter DevB family membrane fusion protein